MKRVLLHFFTTFAICFFADMIDTDNEEVISEVSLRLFQVNNINPVKVIRSIVERIAQIQGLTIEESFRIEFPVINPDDESLPCFY